MSALPHAARSPGRLAIAGGAPVRSPDRPWPTWPQPAPGAAAALAAVLDSGRWAISSPRCGGELYERRFARLFSQYLDVAHCVPVDHGSSALVIALESLGLSHGDVVLVPALTWVATASAVLRAGLVPVLTDVSPETGCIEADGLDLDVDPGAVIVVHWSAVMADVPAITAAVDSRGIVVIEDAAQAHGAQWLGRHAGTIGRLGCFSMQNGKVLTCGEGGAVVTDDEHLAGVLEELRADSRRYRSDEARPGELDLVETATVQGANFCLDEFSAALLCAQLGMLDAQHDIRNRNYARLGELLADVPGVRLLCPLPQQNRISVYEAPIVFDDLPEGRSNRDLADALTAELGVRFYPPREPLDRSHLLRPSTKPALASLAQRFHELHRGRHFPHAERMAGHAVLTHHSTFLGDEEDMVDIAAAVAKVVAANEGGW
ncbi:DegT/DnrJ/EryC1/StrS family aminotransferase [Micromonospora sp. WMMD712]|uniref:DegT/DnrJ/EryC1/StrS family aminotransferase n=1 Tax=Micromonospora sp. WMMD712 TaxID=3016096 RepID=UPI00249A4EF5|nr:DegT/DnrJ/EryC1/StrS family aminotransferase [Micromonospora sp. WMMD712]WFE60205.1 DegT/DnrJ/EryC1/StrS family aminotransferase [Micromonospora sp. WMMD712]